MVSEIPRRRIHRYFSDFVPDTQDYILWNKIGKSIGVYSGVYEYTQQIQEQIQSIQSIRGIWAFAALQVGSLQYNRWFPDTETKDT